MSKIFEYGDKKTYNVSDVIITNDTESLENDSKTNNGNITVENDNNENEVMLGRDFKTRQVSMIAIAGAIGTGVIIGSGTALKRGGPASLFIGYSITGILLIIVLMFLSEMAAFSPMDKIFLVIQVDMLILLSFCL